MGNGPDLSAFLALFKPEFADQVTVELATSVPAALRRVGQTSVPGELEDFYSALLQSMVLQLSLLPPTLAVAFSALLLYVTTTTLADPAEGGESDLADRCTLSH